MKQSKTTQKLNTKLLLSLDKLQTDAQSELTGFIELSHTVKFDHFPSSIFVSCYFENEQQLNQAKSQEALFQKKLHSLLFKQGILLKNASHNLGFFIKSHP